LALLFARLLLLPASSKTRAESARRLKQLAMAGCMAELEQIGPSLASAADTIDKQLSFLAAP
jgi:hypothetical protein